MALPDDNIENADFDAYLTAIPGSILADIYEKYGTRVLELNVERSWVYRDAEASMQG